jgi:hypothetical protein
MGSADSKAVRVADFTVDGDVVAAREAAQKRLDKATSREYKAAEDGRKAVSTARAAAVDAFHATGRWADTADATPVAAAAGAGDGKSAGGGATPIDGPVGRALQSAGVFPAGSFGHLYALIIDYELPRYDLPPPIAAARADPPVLRATGTLCAQYGIVHLCQ